MIGIGGGDIENSLNSILLQDYPSIELFISMEDLGAPVSEIFNILNSNRKDNIVSLNLNFPKVCCGTIEHIKYVKKHMKGKWLLCLHPGEALYSATSLSFFVDTKTISTINICNCEIFGENDEYISSGFYVEDVISSYSHEDGQSLVSQCKGYGLIFERKFVQSRYFGVYSYQDDEFLSQINLYLTEIEEDFFICHYPVIKRRIYEPDRKQDRKNKQQLEIWCNDLNQRQIKLNYSSYIFIFELIAKIYNATILSKQNKINLINEVEKNILYLLKKNDEYHCLSSGNKACAVYLSKIENILRCNFFLRNFILINFLNSLIFEPKIKVVMVVNEKSLWRSCYESVYKLLKSNVRFIVDVVYVPFLHPDKNEDMLLEQKEWYEESFKVYQHKEYDLAEESPDFLIYCKPYDTPVKRWNVEETRKIVDKIIYIPYSMATMRAGEEIKRLMYKLPLHFLAWKYLSYSREHLSQLKEHAYNKNNYLAIGHPKFDITKAYMTMNENVICSDILNKADGRKIFLWNTHFDIKLGENSKDRAGTFLLFGIQFLKWLEDNKDYFVIWRPHPFFYRAFIKALGVDAKAIWERAKKSSNIYIDEYENQWPSLWLADAMISDSSAIIESFIITGKPILITVREKELLSSSFQLYVAERFEEVIQFLNDINLNKDFMYKQRMNYINSNYFIPKTGTVAELLLSEIEKEMKIII